MRRRLLLDSHAFLWFVNDDPRLSRTAREAIEDARNDVLFSVVSVWELSIKARLGRLALKPSVVGFFESQARKNDFTLLPIELRHLAPVSTLPLHHGDPFDRLLIAQALVEGLPLVSGDAAFDAYAELERLW